MLLDNIGLEDRTRYEKKMDCTSSDEDLGRHDMMVGEEITHTLHITR